jgi:hypothetical protein
MTFRPERSSLGPLDVLRMRNPARRRSGRSASRSGGLPAHPDLINSRVLANIAAAARTMRWNVSALEAMTAGGVMGGEASLGPSKS